MRSRAVLWLTLCAALWVGLSWPPAAAAQTTRADELLLLRKSKAQELSPYKPGKLEKYLLKIENERFIERLFLGGRANGFFAKYGTIMSGSGFGGGPGYRIRDLFGGRARFDVFSLYTYSHYWQTEARLLIPARVTLRPLARTWFADVRATHERLPSIDFYGVGPDSLESERSNYHLRNTSFGGTGGYRLTEHVALGGGAEYFSPVLRASSSSTAPSFQTIFTPEEAPAMEEQPPFLHTQVFADINFREPPGNPRLGGWYQVGMHFFSDRELNKYSYKRFDADVQHYFPFLNQRRVIAVRGMYSTTFREEGQQVPFFLMPYLGSSGTLRGFRNFRFRDEHLMMLQLEYRWEIYPAVDAALFYDTGKVASSRSDLNFKDLEKDYGFGVRFGTLYGVFMRVEAAFGSADGTQFRWNFSHVF